jgi:hypothetical protein
MTQQHLIGELSALLDELTPRQGDALAGAVRDLRREVESCSIRLLPSLAFEAMRLADAMCRAAVERGDVREFVRCANAAVALSEFQEASRLRPD